MKKSCSRPKTRFATKVVPAVALLALTAGSADAQIQSPELGVWVDDTGAGAVEIYPCIQKPDRLCGRIVWLREPLNAEGKPKRDRYNPNAERQNQPICGLGVLGNLGPVSEGGFDGGWIYDPKVGKSYSAAIQLQNRDRLVVTGYLGLRFMGKSFAWTRAPAELVRCEGAPPPIAVQPIASPR